MLAVRTPGSATVPAPVPGPPIVMARASGSAAELVQAGDALMAKVSAVPGLSMSVAETDTGGTESEYCTATVDGVTVRTGASLTGVTLIVNVCAPLVSTPPRSVLPSSWILTPMRADPLASGAEV